jgi:hypothetical protein
MHFSFCRAPQLWFNDVHIAVADPFEARIFSAQDVTQEDWRSAVNKQDRLSLSCRWLA